MRRSSERQPPVAVITAAEPSQAEQLRARQRRYLIMMGTRVVCLIAAAVLYAQHIFWAVPVLIVAMIALPWMAVIIANDRPPLKPSRFRRLPAGPAPDRALASPAPGRAIPAADPDRVIDQ
ncbi:MAG: DUF3099 domain-containing protein [Actinomycetota bacterium]|nr:DUF3099 domain-containing protein [Actinomycetota bacterium]